MRLIVAFLLIATPPLCAQTRAAHPDSARIVMSDVAGFWRAFDRLAPAMSRTDSVAVLAGDYIAPGSAGLQRVYGNPSRAT